MKDWSGDATKIFKGKIIKRIEYTTKKESKEMDWQRTPIIIFTEA